MGALLLAATPGRADDPPATQPAKKKSAEKKPPAKKPAEKKPAHAVAPLTIVVADRPLVGPNTSPEMRGDKLLLPVVAIAQALGDSVAVDATQRRVTVRRQTGVVAVFDAATHEVREDDAPVLVTHTDPILFPAMTEQLMLPSELVTALFDVAIRVEPGGTRVRVTRGTANAPAVAYTKSSFVELYEARYGYTNYIAPSSYNYNAMPSLTGRVFDGRLRLLGTFSGGIHGTPFELNHALLDYLRPSGQQLLGIDVGTGPDLPFLSTQIRGAMLRQPLGKGRRIALFAGAAASGLSPDNEYDTFVAGWSGTVGDTSGKGRLPLSLSGGTNFFRGAGREGALVSAALTHATRRNNLRADLGFGGFNGTRAPGDEVRGSAILVDLRDAFTPWKQLSLSALFRHVGTNVLTPEGAGIRPGTVGAGGVTFQPWPWLTTSATYSANHFTVPESFTDHQMAGHLRIAPRTPFPAFNASHSHSIGGPLGTIAVTTAGANGSWGRWHATADFARAQMGDVPALYVGTLGAAVDVTRSGDHRLTAQQSFSEHQFSGAIDWSSSRLFPKGWLDVGAGVGYSVSEGRAAAFGRALVTLRLPWRQLLTATYQQSEGMFQLTIGLSGPLYTSPRAKAAGIGGLVDAGERLCGVHGRVYQDVNLNGRFDPGVDKPQPDVHVQACGAFDVITDKQGHYQVEGLKAGRCGVHLDLLSVRADLTILDGHARQLPLEPGQQGRVDFRVIRTGQLSGTVWIDANGDGKQDENEEPAADVRVVTGDNRDTLTAGDGTYVIGDLPPGEHRVLLDEKTLPQRAVPIKQGPQRVTVRPGEQTRDVNFTLRYPEDEVRVQEFPGR